MTIQGGGGPLPRPPAASNISNLRVTVDADFLGATVNFNIVGTTNTTSVLLLRSMTSSIKAAVTLKQFAVVRGAQAFDDRDPSIVNKQVWYWVQMSNNDDLETNVGPVTVVVKAGSAPHAVNWVEASSDFSSDDSVKVNVVCELFAGADASGGVAVYVSGYQGNAAYVLIFQDATETLSFHLKITGEVVSFKVAAVNASGTASAQSGAVGLTLNGTPTKPARLTGLNALEGNGFTQVAFMASPEINVTLYKLYRSAFGGSFATAVLIKTLVPTDEPQYSIHDAAVNGHASTYQWYVTAVNPVGESTASDAVLPATPWV